MICSSRRWVDSSERGAAGGECCTCTDGMPALSPARSRIASPWGRGAVCPSTMFPRPKIQEILDSAEAEVRSDGEDGGARYQYSTPSTIPVRDDTLTKERVGPMAGHRSPSTRHSRTRARAHQSSQLRCCITSIFRPELRSAASLRPRTPFALGRYSSFRASRAKRERSAP